MVNFYKKKRFLIFLLRENVQSTVGNRKFKFSNLSLENHQILMVIKLYFKSINQFFIFFSNSKEILDFFFSAI